MIALFINQTDLQSIKVGKAAESVIYIKDKQLKASVMISHTNTGLHLKSSFEHLIGTVTIEQEGLHNVHK